MYMQEYERWCSFDLEDPDLLPELLKVKGNEDVSSNMDFKYADGDELVAAYEYCNLHGLWKAEA